MRKQNKDGCDDDVDDNDSVSGKDNEEDDANNDIEKGFKMLIFWNSFSKRVFHLKQNLLRAKWLMEQMLISSFSSIKQMSLSLPLNRTLIHHKLFNSKIFLQFSV